MAETQIVQFAVKISKDIRDAWYGSITHSKVTNAPIRERLEEALEDNIKKHKKYKKDEE
jgi:hypothetical protein